MTTYLVGLVVFILLLASASIVSKFLHPALPPDLDPVGKRPNTPIYPAPPLTYGDTKKNPEALDKSKNTPKNPKTELNQDPSLSDNSKKLANALKADSLTNKLSPKKVKPVNTPNSQDSLNPKAPTSPSSVVRHKDQESLDTVPLQTPVLPVAASSNVPPVHSLKKGALAQKGNANSDSNKFAENNKNSETLEPKNNQKDSKNQKHSDFYPDTKKLPSYTGLTEKTAFDPKGKQYFHDVNNRYSYVTDDIWRPNDAYTSTSNPYVTALKDFLRPRRPDLSIFPNRGEYLKQTIVNDYAPGAEKMFLMIKTGATVLWNRLPIHLSTTLTRVPYFGLYADFATSVGGHEVVDTLANLTKATKNSDQFKLYRDLQDMRDRHAISDPGHAKLSGGWELDKFKNLPMLLHAWNTAPPDTEWFVFMDGDTFLMIDNLMDYLGHLNSSDSLYIGEIQYLGGSAFAHGGSGVVLSRAAMNRSLGLHPQWVNQMEPHARSVCCGDYMVAHMLSKINVQVLGLKDDTNDDWREGEGFETHWLRNRRRREAEENLDPREFQYKRVGHKFQKFPQWDLSCSREEWCNKIIGFHHLSAMDVEILWEYEQLLSPEQRRHVTYCDIYRDFVSPYIEFYMPGWNSMARQKEYTEAQDLSREIEEIEEQLRKKEEEEEEIRKKEEEEKLVEEDKKKAAAKEVEEQKKLKELAEEYKKLQAIKAEKEKELEKTEAEREEREQEQEEKELREKIEALHEKKKGGAQDQENESEPKLRKRGDPDAPEEAGEASGDLKEEVDEENLIDVSEEKTKDDEEQQYLKSLAGKRNEAEERQRLREQERTEKIEEAKKKLHDDAGKDLRPWHSAALCQRKCFEDQYCHSWRYLPEERYCANDDSVRLGRPAFTYLTYDEGEKNRNFENAVSGYMVHRIRQIRRDKGCDVLFNDSEEKNAVQLIKASKLAKSLDKEGAYDTPELKESPDSYEGWYVRRKLHEKFMLNKQEMEKTRKHEAEAKRIEEEGIELLKGNDETMSLEEVAASNVIAMEVLDDELKMLRSLQYLHVKNLNELKRAEAAMLLDKLDREQREQAEEERIQKLEKEKKERLEQERLMKEFEEKERLEKEAEEKKNVEEQTVETRDQAGEEPKSEDQAEQEVKTTEAEKVETVEAVEQKTE